MNEKEYSNVFRFSLTQGETLLCEKMFNADNFNPFTRYSIDVRDILPKAITRLQKALSKRSYDVVAEVGRNESGEEVEYDILGYYHEMLNKYPKGWRNGMRYDPKSITQHIEQKTIRGVPCKIGLYINENPIVEREFFVDGFNPVAKFSIDIMYLVIEITDIIEKKIKNSDVKNMWDDYDLINYRGLTINQVRELPNHKRADMLRRLKRN